MHDFQKSQTETWGEGPEFKALVDSIHRRNDEGPLEADTLAERLAKSGASPRVVAESIRDWALKEMDASNPVYQRARARFDSSLDEVAASLEGPRYPNGSPMAERDGRSLVWSVVNALLRGWSPAAPE